MSLEACQRCGEEGHDRRTLWHSCFYAMNEMEGVPFTQVAIEGQVLKHVGDESLSSFPGLKIPKFEADHRWSASRKHGFFQLRVCKECRGDWMGAIKTWFDTKPVQESCGSGIFVRENENSFQSTTSSLVLDKT